MKKFFVIILILFFVPLFALAESDDWDKMYENDVDIQKPTPVVTDKEFKEAYESKLGKKKKKNPYENIQAHDMSSLTEMENNYPSVLLVQRFFTDDGKILEAGYYKVVVVMPQTPRDKYYVHFFQGHSHKGKVQMFETENDYDQPGVNYAKMIDDCGKHKFIYGTMDCNLEGTLWEAK